MAASTVGVGVGVELLLAEGPFDLGGGGEQTTAPTTNTTQDVVTTSTTRVRVYDVDEDGRSDYAVVNGEVVTVPADPPGESHTAEWLVFAGTIIAALIGAGGLVGVARLNRDSEDEVTALKRRIDLLESS